MYEQSSHDVDEFWAAWRTLIEQLKAHGGADVWLALARLTTLGEQPVEIERLAETVGRPVDETLALARQHRGVQIEGEFINLDPSVGIQRRRLRIGDRAFPASGCAPDVFMWAAVIDKPLRVEETCPITGTPIQVDLTPDRVEMANPPETVVAFQPPPGFQRFAGMRSEEVDAELCSQGPFLASAQAARVWLIEHAGVCVLPVVEAYARARDHAHLFLDAWDLH